MIGEGSFSRVYAAGRAVEKRTAMREFDLAEVVIRDGLVSPKVNGLSLGWGMTASLGVHRMKRGGAVRWSVRAFVDLCLQVYELHVRGLVHNDIKPSNIVWCDGPKLIDFGATRYVRRAPVTEEVSLWYRSPELCTGSHYDLRSDIWSLGCLYYEVMHGAPLFPCDTVYALCRLHAHYEPEGFLRHLLCPVHERWSIVEVLGYFGVRVGPLRSPLPLRALVAYFREQLPDHGDARRASEMVARVMWGEDVEVESALVKYMVKLHLP